MAEFIMTEMQGMLLGLLTYMTCIVFHEFGHYIVLSNIKDNAMIWLKKVNGRITLATGFDWQYENMKKDDIQTVLIVGLFGGAVPIIAVGFLYHIVFLILFLPYAIGARHDLRWIYELGGIDNIEIVVADERINNGHNTANTERKT